MQTPAEKELVEVVASFLRKSEDKPCRLLNAGAGRSLIIENELVKKGCPYTCDRLDIDDCDVSHPNVENCHCGCSVERMEPIESGSYDLVFSNYLLEHVEHVDAAASEMSRVLKPGGLFVASVPNPTALEFMVAKRTSLSIHRWLRGGFGWQTYYSYPSIGALTDVLRQAGLEPFKVTYYPCVVQYVEKVPVLRCLGALYDRFIALIGWNRLMGNVCVTARKVQGWEELSQGVEDESSALTSQAPLDADRRRMQITRMRRSGPKFPRIPTDYNA